MSRWIHYGSMPRVAGHCSYREVIGFMSTRVVWDCHNNAEPGQAYCKMHAAKVKAQSPHSVWSWEG